jgi:ABC-type phosphate transport system substrate-binding protein
MQKHRAIAAAAVLVLGAASAAAADLVVVANPAAGPVTKDQVAEVFLGKSQAFTPVDQPEGSAVYSDFYRKATGRDVAQVKATWARLVFSGKAQAPRQLSDSAAVRKAVAADPKALGYIEKAAVDSSVKVVLSLD